MKISQREARRLKRKLRNLEESLEIQKRKWLNEYPTYECIDRIRNAPETTRACVRTARTLKHAVVVTVQGDDLVFFADKILEVGRDRTRI